MLISALDSFYPPYTLAYKMYMLTATGKIRWHRRAFSCWC